MGKKDQSFSSLVPRLPRIVGPIMPHEYFPNQILQGLILQDQSHPAGSGRPVAVKEREHVGYRLNPGTSCKDFLAPDFQYIGYFPDVLNTFPVNSRLSIYFQYICHHFNTSVGSQIS